MHLPLLSFRLVIDHNTGRRMSFRFCDQISVHYHEALLRPHFSYFFRGNSDFGRSGRDVPRGRTRFGSSQNPGCGAVCSDAVARHSLETSLTGRQTMQKGTVKWFNPTKGYGFIRPSSGDKDVFVHISAVERAGLSTLNEGQTVEYELVTNRGKTSAENLKVS
jgi:cold shock protein